MGQRSSHGVASLGAMIILGMIILGTIVLGIIVLGTVMVIGRIKKRGITLLGATTMTKIGAAMIVATIAGATIIGTTNAGATIVGTTTIIRIGTNGVTIIGAKETIGPTIVKKETALGRLLRK